MIKALSIVLDYGSYHALLVQLVERRSPKPDVGGSSPPGRVENVEFKLRNTSKIGIIKP